MGVCVGVLFGVRMPIGTPKNESERDGVLNLAPTKMTANDKMTTMFAPLRMSDAELIAYFEAKRVAHCSHQLFGAEDEKKKQKFAETKATWTEAERVERDAHYVAYLRMIAKKNAEFWVRMDDESKATWDGWNAPPQWDFKWKECAICHKTIGDDPYGHNPAPVVKRGVCCTKCNDQVVVPIRFAMAPL